MNSQRAVTLIELIVIVIFIGIFAVIALPKFNLAAITLQKADCQAETIVTDLRRARTMAISDAANNTNGYGLQMVEAASPYRNYKIVNLKTSTTIDTQTIDPAITCAGGKNFNFGPLGNLNAGSSTSLTVSAGGKTFTINITSATGLIKCTQN
jgi:Tfp pilus assembly protein PilE